MIQAPMCLVAWVSVYFILELEPPSKDHWVAKVRQIDFLGAFTLVLAVVSLLTGLDSGPNLGWSNRITIVSLSLTPVLFALFLFVEMKIAKHPFAPGHIILSRDLLPCYIVNMCGMAGEMAVMFFVPLYFQAVEGLSATASGSMLVPATIAGVLGSLAGGWIIKRTGKFYWPTVISYGILFFSMIPLTVSVWFRSLVGTNTGFVLSAIGNGGGKFQFPFMLSFLFAPPPRISINATSTLYSTPYAICMCIYFVVQAETNMDYSPRHYYRSHRSSRECGHRGHRSCHRLLVSLPLTRLQRRRRYKFRRSPAGSEDTTSFPYWRRCRPG